MKRTLTQFVGFLEILYVSLHVTVWST